jgi:hypothetical protein
MSLHLFVLELSWQICLGHDGHDSHDVEHDSHDVEEDHGSVTGEFCFFLVCFEQIYHNSSGDRLRFLRYCNLELAIF